MTDIDLPQLGGTFLEEYRIVCFASTSSDQIFLELRAASTIENMGGKQRALPKFSAVRNLSFILKGNALHQVIWLTGTPG